MTADGNDVYGWNAFSKIAWTATSGTPTCGTSGRCATYDAFGRIVETSNGSAWKEYWYTQAGGKMVMNGTTLSYGRWPMPYGMAETVGTTNFDYLHKDWIGNSRIVSNISNNTVVADQAYTPYGEIYNIFGANNGQYQVFGDTIADLAPSTTTPIMWDTPNRELSYTGRWLSPDPAGVGWNQYAYPTNPNSFSDPSGLTPGGRTGPTCLIARPFDANGGGAQGNGCSAPPTPYNGGEGSDPFGGTGQGYTDCDAGDCGPSSIPTGTESVGADSGSTTASGPACDAVCSSAFDGLFALQNTISTILGWLGEGMQAVADSDLNQEAGCGDGTLNCFALLGTIDTTGLIGSGLNVGGDLEVSNGMALAPDLTSSSAMFQNLAGYNLAGSWGMVGDTYTMNISIISSTPGAAQGGQALTDALVSQAQAAGATSISVTGNMVTRAGFFNQSYMESFGWSWQQINSSTIQLTMPLPPVK
jgi:hypothetical protein